MVLICKAVLKSAGAALESLHNPRADNHATQRRISTGCAFAERDHVRYNVPVIHREWLSRASHAGHYFIGDEKHIMPTADVSDALRIAIWRRGRPQSRAHNGLKDKCRY